MHAIDLPLPHAPPMPSYASELHSMVDVLRWFQPTLQEVQYSREGTSEAKVPENTLAVFRFVQEAFVIPGDIDKDHKVQDGM